MACAFYTVLGLAGRGLLEGLGGYEPLRPAGEHALDFRMPRRPFSPWVVALIVVVRRKTAPKIVLVDIAGINLLWCAACFGLLAFGGITPNAFGIAFVAAQALAVALLGVLQLLGLRGATAAA